MVETGTCRDRNVCYDRGRTFYLKSVLNDETLLSEIVENVLIFVAKLLFGEFSLRRLYISPKAYRPGTTTTATTSIHGIKYQHQTPTLFPFTSIRRHRRLIRRLALTFWSVT